MKKVYPLIALVFSFILVCCIGKRETHPDLLRMEVLVQDYPDSALTQLNNYPGNEIPDRYNRAYYYLLLTEAKYKNKQSLLSLDSILDICIKDFDNEYDKELFARASISKGRIWRELREFKQAVEYYYNALATLNKKLDYDLLTELYSELGNIYLNEFLRDDALFMFQQAYIYSKKSANPNHICISARNLGISHLYLGNLDSTFFYFNKALEHAKVTADSISLINMVYKDFNLYYSQTGEYEKAMYYLDNITSEDKKHYLNKGALFNLMDQYDSAKYYLSLSLQSSNIFVRTSAYDELSKLAKKQEDYENAYLYLYQYQEAYDSIMEVNHATDIRTIDHKYNTRLAVTNLINHHRVRMVVIITSFILIIILIISIVTVQNQRKKLERKKREQEILKKETEMANLMYQITTTRNTILKLQQRENKEIIDLQQEIKIKEEELTSLQIRIEKLRDNFITVNPIYKHIMQLTRKGEGENVKMLSLEKREELKRVINTVYVDFIEELKTVCPSLTDEDIFFCCLAKMNLPVTAIRICAGYLQTGSARQRKFRIKKKMTEETNNLQLYNSIFQF